jgi:UDP-GlcNAc:undecaprenyl-phosphate GlcNAc-1-phosphate transferase
VIFVVGQVDDLREVSPPAKAAGTVLAGSILSIAGVSILFFRIPFVGLVSLSPDMSALLTVLWVLGMTTAINYIDGLDGLAAGIVAIAAGALLLYCERLQGVHAIGPENAGPLIAAAVLGACLGFLPHNFHPARIFMGDAGALLLGLLLAAVTITVGGNTDTPFSGQTFFFFAPLFIPLVILGVPIFDTAFSILRRARRGTNVTVADKDHLHHRLMRLGHGQRRSVLILWIWTVLLSAIVLYPTYQTVEGELWVPLAIAAAALVLYTMFGPGVRSRREAD